METEVQHLVDSKVLSKKDAEKISDLKQGAYCFHRSWGVGKVVERDLILGRVVIDFANKKAHSMDLVYGAQSLTLVSDRHIEAMALDRPDELKQMMSSDPVGLVKQAVETMGARATPDQLEKALVPLLGEKGWKSWWEATKKELRKTGQFEIPKKRTEAIVFHHDPATPQLAVWEQLAECKYPRPLAQILDELTKNWRELGKGHTVAEVVSRVDQVLRSVPSSKQAEAVELALARDSFVEAYGAKEGLKADALDRLLPTTPQQLQQLLLYLPASRQSRCLARAKVALGDRWDSVLVGLLGPAPARLAEALLEIFKEDGRLAEFEATLDRFIRERRLGPDLLVWLCKNRKKQFSDLINVNLFFCIITVLEYDQLSEVTRGTKLADMLIKDKTLLEDLLKGAAESEVRDVVRTLKMTSVFEDLSKRSLLAKVVKAYPFVQSMVASERIGGGMPEGTKQVQTFIVSWPSLEARKAELEDIVNRKIPENSRDIAVAREYGDLRENHEFKAAKEMQAVLMRRKAELEAMLANATGTDFKGVSTDAVNIGTRVVIEDVRTGARETVTILGAWDSDPEAGVISYLTAIAQALLQKKPGDEASLPMESGEVRPVRIVSIHPYVDS